MKLVVFLLHKKVCMPLGIEKSRVSSNHMGIIVVNQDCFLSAVRKKHLLGFVCQLDKGEWCVRPIT